MWIDTLLKTENTACLFLHECQDVLDGIIDYEPACRKIEFQINFWWTDLV